MKKISHARLLYATIVSIGSLFMLVDVVFAASIDSIERKIISHDHKKTDKSQNKILSNKKKIVSYRTKSVEEMTITGSYLKTSKNSNANPVQKITNKQIMQTGVTNLNDFLSRMPSVGSSGTNSADVNGGGGAACVDLRNLGSNRVLVLVDGKRLALNAQSNCVDMNTIPIQLVDNIEILKDGSSELYGADAVSGVINIKLKHNVNTGGFMIRGGISGHGDGKTGMLSAYKGWNFDEGRGNITFFGSYNTSEGVKQSSRSWANPVQMDLKGNVFGSAYGPTANWVDNNGNALNKAPRYDFGRQQSLTDTINTGTLSGDAHYDFNKHFTLYSNVLYSHRNANAYMAPEAFYGGVAPTSLPYNMTVPANYPGNPYHQDATLATRRFTELGDRREENASDTYTAKGGLKGEITHHWMYDASFTYGWNQVLEQYSNIGSYQNLLNAYGLRQDQPGNPASGLSYDPSLCPASGCSSPFGPLSAKNASYVNANIHNHSYYQLRDWNLRIHNNEVARAPWEHGGKLGIALGMEHRGEQLSSRPDSLVSSGQSMTSSTAYTGGGFHVTEGYLEGNLNLLKNAFLAKDLTLDGQARVSGYNSFGVTKNWKASLSWMPTRDIHFKGTLGTSFRQPSVYELYQGQGLDYALAQDPCDMGQVGTYGGDSAAVASRCASQHINSQKFVATGTGQVATMVGGNKNLRPETSRTYTIGVELTPRWVKRLDASVEYWHTDVENMIGSPTTQYVLDQCYIQGEGCQNVIRNSATGQIQQVNDYTQNMGGMRTSGLDFDLNYSLPLTPYDVLSLNNNLQQVFTYKLQNVRGGQWYNYDGRLLYQNGGSGSTNGVPSLRDYASFTWRHNHFSIIYMMQYMGGMVWNNGTRDLTSADAAHHSTPGMFEHDVTLNYRLKKWNFEGGIQNIANKRPPFVVSGVNNTASNLYSNFYIGRYFFLQAGVEF